MQHIADNHEALLDYLYEEGDAAERLRVARHLQECALCSVAVLEFQSVRGMLRDWRPPVADLGFRLVQDRDAAVPAHAVERNERSRWARGFGAAHLSRWSQAAAAVLLLAAVIDVYDLHVHSSDAA
jgi:anti-sigma factor RsiW